MSTRFAKLIDDYTSGPELLARSVEGLSTEHFDARPVPGRWSTRQVVAHIADFEPIYADRIKRVIAEDQPPLRGGDPDLFAAELAYATRAVDDEIAMVTSVRRHLAAILRTLSADQFRRIGIHTEAGPVTLESLLESITRHIPHHVRFIEEKRRALGV